MENNWTSAPLLPSRANSTPRGFEAGWSILTLIGLAFTYLLAPLAYVGAWALITHPHIDRAHVATAFPPDVQLIAQTVTYLPVAIYLLAILPPLAKTTLADLGFRMPDGRAVLVGVAGAFAMYLVTAALSIVIESTTHQKATEEAIALLNSLTTGAEKIVFIIVAAVLAPMIEELMFRVFLLNAIRRYWGATAAIVISGVIFGFVHAAGSTAQILPVGVPLMGAGIVLGAIYVYSKNYWSSVITHACFNAFNVIGLLELGFKN